MNDRDLLVRFEECLVGIGMAPATITNYLADVRAFSQWLGNLYHVHISLLNVAAVHVQRYCQELYVSRRSTATVNRRLQAIRKFYDLAVQEGWVSQNPAREVDRFDERSGASPRVLTVEEACRLLHAVGNGADGLSRRDRAILLLLLKTGLKVSELISLREDDLELDVGRGYVLIGQDLQSGGRCLPIGSETCAALRNYMRVRASAQNVDELFVNRQGQPLSARSVHRLVSNYAQAAELEGVSAHTLRYTFAHGALKHADASEVARMLGLRDVSGMRRYLVDPDRR